MLQIFLVFILAAGIGINEPSGPTYEWKQVAPAGSGCFQGNCKSGQFAMAIKPLAGMDGDLFLVGDNTVWRSSDGIKWNSRSKTDWGERYGLAFAYFRDNLWMSGGMRSWDDFRNDVWSSVDGTEWKQVATNAPWKNRRGHAMLVFRGKLWIIGGSLSSGRPDKTPTEALNDVWSSSDGINWTQVVNSAPWTPRETSTALVFDNKIWIFGVHGRSGDIWSSDDGRNWTLVNDSPEYGRGEGSGIAALDGKIWIYGGVGRNDVWSSVDGRKWIREIESAPWSARATGYSAVYKNKLLLFSGKTGRADTQTGEIWAMSKTKME